MPRRNRIPCAGWQRSRRERRRRRCPCARWRSVLPSSLAITSAVSVLPQPGGPQKSTRSLGRNPCAFNTSSRFVFSENFLDQRQVLAGQHDILKTAYRFTYRHQRDASLSVFGDGLDQLSKRRRRGRTGTPVQDGLQVVREQMMLFSHAPRRSPASRRRGRRPRSPSAPELTSLLSSLPLGHEIGASGALVRSVCRTVASRTRVVALVQARTSSAARSAFSSRRRARTSSRTASGQR